MAPSRRASGGASGGSGGWRTWVTSPLHLTATVGAILVGGLLTGFAIAAISVFPSQDEVTGLKRVPRLVGLSAAAARTSLEDAGFGFEQAVPVHHESVEAGVVIAQDPLPGQGMTRGGTVHVTLSLGTRERQVPDIIGLEQAAAERALRSGGFETEAVLVDSESNVGEVVGTRPNPGASVRLPASVTLVVSAGPRSVAVPDLVTRSTVEARQILERLGLRLGSVSQDSSSLAAPGTVIRQSPLAGGVVERGAHISVTVAIVPPPPPDTQNAIVDDSLSIERGTE